MARKTALTPQARAYRRAARSPQARTLARLTAGSTRICRRTDRFLAEHTDRCRCSLCVFVRESVGGGFRDQIAAMSLTLGLLAGLIEGDLPGLALTRDMNH